MKKRDPIDIDPGYQIPNQGPGPVIYPWPNIPGQGPGPVIPPWLNPNQPGIPNFPPIPGEEEERLRINLKSVYTDAYVIIGAENLLYAIIKNPKDSQTFVMIQLEDNQVKIRVKGGNFIRVDENGFLVADTNKKGASIFNVYKASDEEYVLMAPNGLYVRVRDRDDRLVAKAQNPGPRTRFKFRQVKNL